MTSRYSRTIRLTLNGRAAEAQVAVGESLLDVLRRCFKLHGCRDSCGQGVCGACTVIVDGQTVSSCLLLAGLADGCRVETVEGLGAPDRLHPVQEAFIDEGGFQCGFCTPGMVVAACQLLRENPQPTTAEIRHYLAGNLCRCGAYPQIIRAVHAAAEAISQGRRPSGGGGDRSGP